MSVSFADALNSITHDQPPLTIPVGLTSTGTMLCMDLAKAPHALMAGVTGSGKSVGINVGITTIMERNKPEDVRFWMVDPKRVELSAYRGSAFVDEVVTDMDDAADLLEALVDEMERRYSLFEDWKVKALDAYIEESGDKLPLIVVVIDELADLMDTHRKTVEPLIIRLGQLARAAGIHMLMATQRPAADTVPKRILSNVPTRIGYRTQSHTESRLILGERGAEDLKGNGDLLALLAGGKGITRAQGPYISEAEIAEVVAKHPSAEPDEVLELVDDEPEQDEPEPKTIAPEPVEQKHRISAEPSGMGGIIARAIAETATQTRMADLEEIDRLKRRITDLEADNDQKDAHALELEASLREAREAKTSLHDRIGGLEAMRVDAADALAEERASLARDRAEARAEHRSMALAPARQMTAGFLLSMIVIITSTLALVVPGYDIATSVTSIIMGATLGGFAIGNVKAAALRNYKDSKGVT